MDLIVKTQEKQVTITVKGYLKAITSDELGKHHIWHNPSPHYLGIPFKLDFDSSYKAEVQFNL